MTTCDDICIPMPGMTVLADGRVIWVVESPAFSAGIGLLERQLTTDGLRILRRALDASGLLDASGTYEPVKTSDADVGHGATWYEFRRSLADRVVSVFTVDPDVFDADNARFPGTWAIPDAVRTLSALAEGILDPPNWFPETAWAEPAHEFEPSAYLLIIDADRSDPPEPGEPDVNDVEWPFATPITEVGEAYVVDGEPREGLRCLVVTPETMSEMVAAETRVEHPDEPRTNAIDAPFDAVRFAWAAGPGHVTITSRMLLPDQPRSCEEGGRW